ncbi:hypothetical protein [Legionella tunisiensis]|uniref:hypothetical protein n=1 Tax=Legionella tunisiensis TaxID=1034944 RepID=UPI00030849E7|nr:hypothetical protein [Legionella tunisiensis]
MNPINLLNKWFVSIMLALIPLVASAAIPEWEIIPSESSLSFTATQNGAPVKGQFKNLLVRFLLTPVIIKPAR